MKRDEVHEIINGIFQMVFDDDSIIVEEDTTAADIEEWDSLEQINLIVAIEKRFNIKFTLNEVKGFDNVGAMIDVILEKC